MESRDWSSDVCSSDLFPSHDTGTYSYRTMSLGLDCLYDSICLYYRQSTTFASCQSLLSQHFLTAQTFTSTTWEGDQSFFIHCLQNPSEFLWEEYLWSCDPYLPYYSPNSINTNTTSGTVSTPLGLKRQRYQFWIQRLTYCLVQAFLEQVKSLPAVKSRNSKSTKTTSTPSSSSSSVNSRLLFLLTCFHPLAYIVTGKQIGRAHV